MQTASEQKTIVAVFSNMDDAQEAVRDLAMEGVSQNDISIVAHENIAKEYDTNLSTPLGSQVNTENYTGTNTGYNDTTDNREIRKEDRYDDTTDEAAADKTADVAADAGIGAAIGGVGGLLLSAAGLMTVPVIGPILAAGPIAAALTGVGVGAAAGGLIGALTGEGVPENDAKNYAEGVRRGDVLVSVRTAGMLADRAREILDMHHAVNINERVADWKKEGWTGWQDSGKPLSADEFSRERENRRSWGGEYDNASGRSGDRTPDAPDRMERPNADVTPTANLWAAGSNYGSSPSSDAGADSAKTTGERSGRVPQTSAKEGLETARKIQESNEEPADENAEHGARSFDRMS